MTANNYGELNLLLPMFEVAGAISVTIPAYEVVTMQSAISMQAEARPRAIERLYVSDSTAAGAVFVVREAMAAAAQARGLADRHFRLEDGATFGDTSACGLDLSMEGDDAFELSAVIAEHIAALERFALDVPASLRVIASLSANELLRLAGHIAARLVLPVSMHEAVAVHATLEAQTEAVLSAMETALLGDTSRATVETLQSLTEGIAMSDGLRLSLSLSIAEALRAAGAAHLRRELHFAAEESVVVAGDSTRTRVVDFIARDRFKVADPGTGNGDVYRAPYYLWGDGRWTAYAGDGVSGRLDKKP